MEIDELNEIGWHLRSTAKTADRLIEEFRSTIKERDRLKRRVKAFEGVLASLTDENREEFNRMLFVVEKGLPLFSKKDLTELEVG